MKKVNKSVKVIQKIQEYINNSSDIVNKAQLFNNHLINYLLSGAKVVTMLVDFSWKMEDVLEDMRSLIVGLKLGTTSQLTFLNQVPNIFRHLGIGSISIAGDTYQISFLPTRSSQGNQRSYSMLSNLQSDKEPN